MDEEGGKNELELTNAMIFPSDEALVWIRYSHLIPCVSLWLQCMHECEVYTVECRLLVIPM